MCEPKKHFVLGSTLGRSSRLTSSSWSLIGAAGRLTRALTCSTNQRPTVAEHNKEKIKALIPDDLSGGRRVGEMSAFR